MRSHLIEATVDLAALVMFTGAVAVIAAVISGAA